MSSIHKIAVIGIGYVGLPNAVIFASKGFSVIGVDKDESKVNAVNKGVCYIRERDIDAMLRDVVSRGLLEATVNILRAVEESDAVIVTVNTPVKGGVVDLSQFVSALESIRRGLRREHLVIVESTVPPGTTGGLARRILEASGLMAEDDFYLAHVPERIAPGRAIEELLNVPRVVGGVGPRSTERAVELYSRVNSRLYPTNATTAEFVKLIENAYRDLNIAFANLIALMAERLDIDAYEAISLANTHPRVSIHRPGAGVGGPCLTKDPYMLASIMPDFWGTELIRLARRINEYMPLHVVELVERAIADSRLDPRTAKVAVLGAAYKGGVDDTRESPAKYIVQRLLEKRLSVVVYDPYTEESFGAARAGSVEEVFEGADVVVIVTDHPEFKNLDIGGLGRLMRSKVIVDGKRVVDPYVAYREGFKYYGVGFGRAFNL